MTPPSLDGEDVVVRSSRSRSLTDRQPVLPTVASDRDADGPQEQENDAAMQPRMRRAMSADVPPSLSLLQQELGYPRPRAVHGGSTSSSCLNRRRGSCSRRSRNASVISVVSTEADSSLCGLGECCIEDDGRHNEELELEADGTDSVSFDDDDDDNFLDGRIATVTGYARDTDDVVYYEIVVESVAHGPLSAYKERKEVAKTISRKRRQLEPSA
ncbi:hypothetical protein P43SY_000819 [Pythium insidiosum]|uniref:Uncharacterized protein n=1 Tax=Pythium insidiosum TaxID=114742 RepID=A0AAD5M0U3_PYTIN|nr:hypothetical protein P43SY_000819 [Pythium insidiosum]